MQRRREIPQSFAAANSFGMTILVGSSEDFDGEAAGGGAGGDEGDEAGGLGANDGEVVGGGVDYGEDVATGSKFGADGRLSYRDGARDLAVADCDGNDVAGG